MIQKKISKWFTLIEIVIVIVIITILMAVTMRFGSSRMQDLKTQATKEQFLGAYSQIASQYLVSNYLHDKRFSQLFLNINSWSSALVYRLDSSKKNITWFVSPDFRFSDIILNDSPADQLQLKFVPYTLWCELSNWSESTWLQASFRLFVLGRQYYCFSLQSSTCKLSEQVYPK